MNSAIQTVNKLKAEINKRATDSRFFLTTKRGELHELREELNSNDVSRQKNAIKKVIANMTLGRDVSMVYADVVKLSRTSSLELKKLVYLYIMNNSKLQPEKAILAVNTFVQDSQHEKPVVRALAIRTMLCIRVEEVLEYTLDPLKRALRDSDPYVRKTAALGVLKLYSARPKMCQDHGLLELLKDGLHDSSPMVVANTAIALHEVHSLAQVNGLVPGAPPLFELNTTLINKLLNALPECTEWGQIVILDFIASYYMGFSPKDVETLLDRVVPRLAHLNPSIVLSSIRVLIKYLEFVADEQKAVYLKKVAPPIITLLNSYPEIEYIVLRNILVIIQKYPALLAKDVKAFFCKYNDPQYVKMEKLSIVLKLLNDRNYQSILAELKEYCSEIDVEFVRRAVKSIGFCALKIPAAAESSIEVLMDLIKAKQDFIVNDCVVAIKDILRKYPGRFEGVIRTVCENLDNIDNGEAKQSLIWIIGEYAEKIENPVDLLQVFVESFRDEPTQVQLQVLVATVKVFLKYPDTNDALLQSVLRMCAEESDNPDLRDRAYLYWRLLSNEGMVETLGTIVLGQKPTLASTEYALPRALLEELLCNLNTLASTYHRMPNSFSNMKPIVHEDGEEDDEEEEGEAVPIDSEGNELPHAGGGGGGGEAAGSPAPSSKGPTASPAPVAPPPPIPTAVDPFDEFFGPSSSSSSSPLTATATAKPAAPATPVAAAPDILGDLFAPLPAQAAPSPLDSSPVEVLLTPDKANGLRLAGCFVRTGDSGFAMDLTFENQGAVPLSGFALQLNKNTFGFAAAGPAGLPPSLMPGAVSRIRVPLTITGERTPQPAVQIALKNSAGLYYGTLQFPFHLAFNTAGYIADKKEFIGTWKALPDAGEVRFPVPTVRNPNAEAVATVFRAYNIHLIAKASKSPQQDNLYFSCRAFGAENVLLEVVLQRAADGGPATAHCSVKGLRPEYVKPLEASIAHLLAL